ncbi:uncharacterized protein LOC110102593 isoform X3 [Dendrobium catenatum]|uniref:uncharacterized protein LOC110102593 isoform X3 n=1 Tax=Dendrobium catenatum TaxID=906689 RepID=UPI0009F45FB2|nr:uncharacterized protein LOC110102593 isoform X3 [Dendrobium catenatum]
MLIYDRVHVEHSSKSISWRALMLCVKYLVLGTESVSIMARRNSYMPPTPESHPFHLYNPQNHNPGRHLAERTMLAPTENTVFNHSMRLPNPRPANSGVFHGQYHCPISAASSSQCLPYPTQCAPYCYDQHAYVNGANMFDPKEENVRVAFKRKHPSTHPAYQNDLGYCFTGGNFQLKPVPGCRRPQSSTSVAIRYPSDTFLLAGEQHQRNVRSRHDDASFSLSWPSSSSNPPHQSHTSVNNSSFNVVGQCGLPRLPRTHAHLIHPTDAGFSSSVMNPSVSANVITGGSTNNHDACYSEQWRNLYSVLPTSHASAPRGTVAGPSRYNHRQTSAAAYKDSVSFVAGSVAFRPNPSPFIRNGGLRISNEAQPLFNEENGRVRWTSQDSAMFNVPSYFNPPDLLDEHRDLRLDIDDMSYEELLDLQDSIGNVNTGLSEDQLSVCLTKTMYCSTRALEDQLESSCSICLEEYRDEDNLGMMKCLHVYHFDCINDWLSKKNACPICKAPALEDMP